MKTFRAVMTVLGAAGMAVAGLSPAARADEPLVVRRLVGAERLTGGSVRMELTDPGGGGSVCVELVEPMALGGCEPASEVDAAIAPDLGSGHVRGDFTDPDAPGGTFAVDLTFAVPLTSGHTVMLASDRRQGRITGTRTVDGSKGRIDTWYAEASVAPASDPPTSAPPVPRQHRQTRHVLATGETTWRGAGSADLDPSDNGTRPVPSCTVPVRSEQWTCDVTQIRLGDLRGPLAITAVSLPTYCEAFCPKFPRHIEVYSAASMYPVISGWGRVELMATETPYFVAVTEQRDTNYDPRYTATARFDF